jgi:hypothetical protein
VDPPAELLKTQVLPQLPPGAVFQDSFWVEAANYLRHEGVRERSLSEKVEIVRRLGEFSLRLPGDSPAGDVRSLIYWLCPDRHSTCSAAAQTILELSPWIAH